MRSFRHRRRRVVQAMLRTLRMVLSRVVPGDRSISRYVFLFILAQIDESCAKRSTPLSEHLLQWLHAVEFVLIRTRWSNLNRAESLRGNSFEVSGQMTLPHVLPLAHPPPSNLRRWRTRIQPSCRSFNYPINVGAICSLHGTLPDGQNAPSRPFQLPEYAAVNGTVPKNLGPPESDIGRGPFEQNALMSMPKASVNEDHRSKLWENQIRFAWQTCDVQSVAKTARKQFAPDQ